ncbi:subtilisin-like protein [Lophiostoma macrostomum CBS 122681]|uniref:Subtilisin-like protein n=1 Tax=Lophiostoma macrostomum CBS 122681 TaxID=1314788 RepID=A0A6A6SHK3_9PLEO|nr:subtilisin-like protein [Lophiostoma macrostomum CBS 122681]
MIRIVLLFLFVSVISAIQVFDPWNRDNSESSNTITQASTNVTKSYFAYPYTDDFAKNSAIQTVLEAKYHEKNVVQHRDADGHLYWRVCWDGGNPTNDLHATEGIGIVLPESWPEDKRRSWKRSNQIQRNEPKRYSILAKDSTNDEETKQTRDFLNSKMSDASVYVWEYHTPGTSHIEGWSGMPFTDTARAEVEAYSGVERVSEAATGEEDRILPPRNERQQPTKGRARRNGGSQKTNDKRSLSWDKQENAGRNLVMISQPQDTDLNKMKDFVFEKNAGKGTWIYIIDSGADGDHEFNAESVEKNVIQTPYSKSQGQKPEEDDGTNSHGTVAGSIALGRKHGVAKVATLISVKLVRNKASEFIQALEMVIDDLNKPENQQRLSKTVVVLSQGYVGQLNHDSGWQHVDGQEMGRRLQDLFALGVPFVTSSGNRGELFEIIDRIPSVLADENTPIINVGNVYPEGDRVKASQRGPQLTIDANGEDVEGQSKEDGKTLEHQSGTSFAAPQVAGIIATYMGYDNVPWDKDQTMLDRVKAIKNYIQSDSSSWARQKEKNEPVKVLWNGVTKDIRNQVGAHDCEGDSNNCDQKPRCTGLGTNKYGTQSTYDTLIDQSFCPDWNPSNGGVNGSFLQSTPESVNFAIIAPTNGQRALPTGEDCKKNLRAILDACDTEDNPMNWKAGGDSQVDGWTYQIAPQSDRPPAPKNPIAWCKFQEGEKDGSFRVWGAGWLNSGFGHELKDKFIEQDGGLAFPDGHGYDTGSWDFGYELRNGHEWTFTMDYSLAFTPFNIKGLTSGVLKDTANFDGFEVTCED